MYFLLNMGIFQPAMLVQQRVYMDVSKNRGKKPKMDGLFHGTPYFLMDYLGFSHYFGSTPI